MFFSKWGQFLAWINADENKLFRSIFLAVTAPLIVSTIGFIGHAIVVNSGQNKVPFEFSHASEWDKSAYFSEQNFAEASLDSKVLLNDLLKNSQIDSSKEDTYVDRLNSLLTNRLLHKFMKIPKELRPKVDQLNAGTLSIPELTHLNIRLIKANYPKITPEIDVKLLLHVTLKLTNVRKVKEHISAKHTEPIKMRISVLIPRDGCKFLDERPMNSVAITPEESVIRPNETKSFSLIFDNIPDCFEVLDIKSVV